MTVMTHGPGAKLIARLEIARARLLLMDATDRRGTTDPADPLRAATRADLQARVAALSKELASELAMISPEDLPDDDVDDKWARRADLQ